MKKLENYGVLEMNAKQIKETDGGIFPLLLFVAIDIFVLGAATGIAARLYDN